MTQKLKNNAKIKQLRHKLAKLKEYISKVLKESELKHKHKIIRKRKHYKKISI